MDSGRGRDPERGAGSAPRPTNPSPAWWFWTSACRTWTASSASRRSAGATRVKVVMLSASTTPDLIEEALRRGQCVRPEDGRPDGACRLDAAPGDRGHRVLDDRSSRRIHLEGGAKAAGLTDREVAILTELASGKSNDEIAKELWVTQRAVKFHLTNVYRKLGAKKNARTPSARRTSSGLIAPPGRRVGVPCWLAAGIQRSRVGRAPDRVDPGALRRKISARARLSRQGRLPHARRGEGHDADDRRGTYQTGMTIAKRAPSSRAKPKTPVRPPPATGTCRRSRARTGSHAEVERGGDEDHLDQR